ncbi:MAG: class I SAM-dependent methyltransferase [Dehalococcoidia bacterium]
MKDRIPIEVDAFEGYARWATTYDSGQNALILLEEAHVRDLLADIPRQEILDLAAGTGRHALRLASSGTHVTALDQSAPMVAAGRRAAAATGAAVEFVLARVEDGLPFVDRCFDLIICALALCHMSDIAVPLRECARVVRPGGHLLITDFHPASVVRGMRTQFSTDDATYWLPNMPHSRQDYLNAVTGAGFDLLAVRDLPVRNIPSSFAHQSFVEQYSDVDFCLLILARRA